MIRMGQMLLATALKRHREHSAGPGRGCLLSPSSSSSSSRAEALAPLEQKFLDDKRSPFSIFSFIEVALGRDITVLPSNNAMISSPRLVDGEQYVPTRQPTKKNAGDWFGPTTISETIAA